KRMFGKVDVSFPEKPDCCYPAGRCKTMWRAAMAHDASLLLFFFRLLANGPVRRQDFVPILIVLLHRIYFPLMLRAIWVAGFVAKPLRAIPGSEIEPTAHQSSLRQQLAANKRLIHF